MCLSDWSSDVCSSDLAGFRAVALGVIEGDGPEPRGRFGPMVRIEVGARARIRHFHPAGLGFLVAGRGPRAAEISVERSEERRVGKESRWRWRRRPVDT